MMPGCSSLADVRASRWNRSTNSLSNASENGRTLMATSRSSCFSRALKTIAMPPRPSSSRISYSSLSCSRTRSTSVTSGAGSRPPAIGVAARSSPQDRQNLLASSFWVPQRGQYIKAPRGRGNLGIRRSGCQLDTARAQPREPGRGAGRPRVARIGERVDPQLVDADGEMAERAAHQRQRDTVFDAAHRRTLPGELAIAIAAQRKGARRTERRREVDAHALRRDPTDAEQRPEGSARAAGCQPDGEYRVPEAAWPRRAHVPGEPGAQLVRPARGARLIPP